jgi:hypothetical protein
MASLLNVAVPAAGTYTSPVFQLREPAGANPAIMAQATLSYGSGGTSINVYVQSSVDGGGTWSDVISFNQSLPGTHLRQTAAVVQGNSVAADSADAGLAAGTNNPAAFGNWWRVKYVVAGAYAASNLRVDVFSNVGIVPAGVGA